MKPDGGRWSELPILSHHTIINTCMRNDDDDDNNNNNRVSSPLLVALFSFTPLQ